MSRSLCAALGRSLSGCLRAGAAASVTLLFAASASLAAEYFVAPGGSDTNPGTADQPWATLPGASARLRELRQADTSPEPTTVWLRSGVYELANDWHLTEQDSGTEAAPITYAAYAQESVRLVGGRRITQFTPAAQSAWRDRLPSAARDHVVVSDLNALEVPHGAHGQPRGGNRAHTGAALEVYVPGETTYPARFPNAGWLNVSAVTPDNRWQLNFSAPDLVVSPESPSMWLHGFWAHDWEDTTEHISRIDTAAGQLTITPQSDTPIPQAGARFRIVHSLEQLDAPGEWYVDTSSGQLLLWPPNQERSLEAMVSLLDTPISLYGVSHVRLVGLTIEAARVSALEIAGGSSVEIRNCVVRHSGSHGIHVFHGHAHEVVACEIAHCGETALRVEGGDRATLTPAQHRIAHNHIHHFGQTCLSYRPAVEIDGVGVEVSHNEIAHGPHAAVIVHGNDHDVAYNDIHHVAQETDDVGAIYLSHNPTYRGNTIRYNYLHDLGGYSEQGVIGVYLDDFASGTTVEGNAFERTGRAIAIGGGRDNVIRNNLIVDCIAGIQIDGRGRTWARDFFAGGEASQFAATIESEEVDRELFASRYPGFESLLESEPERAAGNQIEHNLIYGPHALEQLEGLTSDDVIITANFVNDTSHLLDPSQPLSQRLDPESPVLSQGFDPIPWNRIGPRGTDEEPPVAPESPLREVSTVR